jgi:hypothetical protein
MLRSSAIALLLAIPAAALGAEPVTAPSFEKDIRPILKAYCFDCHGEEEKPKGKLDVRLRHLIVKGGKSGPGLVPGKRGDSILMQRLEKGEMPPGKKKLTAAQVALIGRWIDAGAPTLRPEPATAAEHDFTLEEQQFWAFQPIRTPALPKVAHTERVATPIDTFLLARLEAQGISYAAEANRRALLRRATFDLTGLPPTPEETATFLSDTAPDSYERLLDRLLASPRYGERWGRHWLDIAGYADSEGYTAEDTVRPDAYKYRDYVIRSINADKPWDLFIQEQLAGDEMVRPPYQNLSPEAIEKLTATGFLRMAPDGTASGVDQAIARNQVMADTLKIVSTSLLGLSVACAQCHSHKYDPIPQSDYYRLRAIFEPALDWKNWRPPPARRVSLYTDADRKKAQEIEAEAVKIDAERLKKQEEYIQRTFDREVAKLAENLREPARQARQTAAMKRTPEQVKILKDYPSLNVSAGSLYLYDRKAAEDLKQYAAKATAIRVTKPIEEHLRAVTEVPGTLPVTHLFNRGDHAQPKQALAPGDLTILDRAHVAKIPAKDSSLPTSGRRLAFARSLTDGKHPLTARVLVNRVWMNHFGRGIVASPGDFGILGERPTHPELLDWLAHDFMAGGWRLKRLHKTIMLSSAYRQSSSISELGARNAEQNVPHATLRDPRSMDPDNRLLWRMPVRRLEAEAIRDSILAASGKLNVKMFGPPVPVMEDEVGQFVVGIENKNGENRPGAIIPLHGEEFRRSVYVQVRRSRPLAMLDTFDAPTLDPNCEARNASTVAPQSLLFMNNDFVLTHAAHMAERVQREAGADLRAQVTLAWRLTYASEPSDAEVKEATGFLTAEAEQFRAKPEGDKAPSANQRALACFCQALLSSNRFLYVD